ncbi:MAG: hypothetical protein RBQ81_01385 [Arcobacteraceae bacterium]|jgi:hypothetical protein|nr:hypothetical protein [Arcobacteraceae bacterium]MDY0364494.1 hypothetical protein [Arcobacteraceae bacterium]
MYIKYETVETARFLTDDKRFEKSINHTVSYEEIWNNFVDDITFEFDLKTRKPLMPKDKTLNYTTFHKFEKAVYEYLEEKNEKKYLKDISKIALKNFLYLLPVFDRYSPSIAIDSDTGFIDTTFSTRDNGLFTALVTENGEIHYSRVSKGVKIYKFSGVAKIKDSRDFKHFSKVLEML